MKIMQKIAMGVCVLLLAATPAHADEWNYLGVVYGWLSGFEGTIGVGDVNGQPVDASFDDLLGFLDFAIGGHFEARHPDAVVLADVWYANLGSTRDGQAANQPVSVDFDMTQWILELGGGWRATPEIDLLLAGRYYILGMGATGQSIAGSNPRSADQSWGDIYIGARYARDLREKWFVEVRGDIGTGGSDFAWFGEASAGYRFTPLLSAVIAYRILSLDREPSDGDYFKYDVTQDGIGLGLGFSF